MTSLLPLLQERDTSEVRTPGPFLHRLSGTLLVSSLTNTVHETSFLWHWSWKRSDSPVPTPLRTRPSPSDSSPTRTMSPWVHRPPTVSDSDASPDPFLKRKGDLKLVSTFVPNLFHSDLRPLMSPSAKNHDHQGPQATKPLPVQVFTKGMGTGSRIYTSRLVLP